MTIYFIFPNGSKIKIKQYHTAVRYIPDVNKGGLIWWRALNKFFAVENMVWDFFKTGYPEEYPFKDNGRENGGIRNVFIFLKEVEISDDVKKLIDNAKFYDFGKTSGVEPYVGTLPDTK